MRQILNRNATLILLYHKLSVYNTQLKNGKKVVFAAVKQNRRALEFASADLKNERSCVR